jgi:hypothetical protein
MLGVKLRGVRWLWLGLPLSVAACQRAPKAGSNIAWRVDQTYVYDTSLSTRATLENSPPIDLNLVARLEVRVLSSANSVVELSLRCVDAKLTTGNDVVDPAIQTAEQDLAKPVWVQLRGGVVDKERFPAGLSAAAVAVDRTLVAALQLPAHAPGSKQWQASEFDGTGRYTASYSLAAGKDSDPQLVLAKRKLVFEELLITGKVTAPTRASLVPKIIASQLSLELADGTLSKAHGEDRLESSVMGSRFDSRASLSLALASTRESPGSSAARAALLANTVALEPNAAYGQAPSHDRFDALRIEGQTFESVLALLEQRAKNPQPEELIGSKNGKAVPDSVQASLKDQLGKDLNAFSALAALLRKDPQNVAKAKAAISAHSVATDKLVDGLSSAGSTEAQAVLSELILDSKLPLPLRATAATGLIRGEHPSPQALVTMHVLTLDPDLADFGVFGLGTASRHLREDGNAAAANKLAEELVELLRTATEDPARIRALRGIANSAYVGAIPTVRPLLKAKDATVRAAAIEALRLVKDPTADTLVAESMTSETSNEVRSAAIRVAAGRTPSDTLESALNKTALEAPDDATRQQAVELIASWLPQRQGVRATLERVAQKDPQPRIRDVALAALKKT